MDLHMIAINATDFYGNVFFTFFPSLYEDKWPINRIHHFAHVPGDAAVTQNYDYKQSLVNIH